MSQHDTAIPYVPLGLGLAGLIPFWALAIGLSLRGAFGLTPELLESALATYGAIILSFLGGIRWGLAVAADAGENGSSEHKANYVISVVPSLLAWAALAAPEPWRLGLLALIAAALGPIDFGLVRGGITPVWFGRLRLILSTGAGVALAFAALSIR